MIKKQIVCDRCGKTVFDTKQKSENIAKEVFGALFGSSTDQQVGYAEINVTRFDGVVTQTIHLCEKCYDIAVNALNDKSKK